MHHLRGELAPTHTVEPFTHAARTSRKDGQWDFSREGDEISQTKLADAIRDRELHDVPDGVPDGKHVVSEHCHWNTGVRTGISFFYYEVW